MFETLTVRRSDIDHGQPHPRIVVHNPLTMLPPPKLISLSQPTVGLHRTAHRFGRVRVLLHTASVAGNH